MKKIVILSAAILSACIVAPFAGKASLPSEKTSAPTSKLSPTAKSIADSDRVTYVIMRAGSTGSMIPTVYRVYHGRITSSSSRSGAIYADLLPTGSESVAGSLTRLDPSITTALHR